jgi:hypothetical protein
MSSLISKLLAMLGSDSDGEVLNAVRALRQHLKDSGKNFSDLAAEFERGIRARPLTLDEQTRRWRAQWEQEERDRERKEQERREQRERQKKAQQERREREKHMPRAERRRIVDLRLIQAMPHNKYGHYKNQLQRLPDVMLRADTIGWSLDDLQFVLKNPRGGLPKNIDANNVRRLALQEKVKQQLGDHGEVE